MDGESGSRNFFGNAGGPIPSASVSSKRVRFSNVRLERAVEGLDIIFDISWDDSWRNATNWDAVWVFFKFSGLRSTRLDFPHPESAEFVKALDACNGGKAVRMISKWCSTPPIGHPPVGRDTGPLFEPVQMRRGEAYVAVLTLGEKWLLSHRLSPELPVLEFLITKDMVGNDLKIRMSRVSTWQHARLTAPSGRAANGATLTFPDDEMGVFIQRSTPQETPAQATFLDVRVHWDESPDRLEKEIKIWPFGLEMVYIPEGGFWLGDPGDPNGKFVVQNSFYDSRALETSGNWAYRVGSEGAITVGDGQSSNEQHQLWYSNDDDAGGVGDQKGPIPPEFPKGYQAFYLMKNPASQGEYASFINTLYGGDPSSYGQLLRYSYEGAGAYRNTIYISNESVLTRAATRPLRPCNQICWADALAFAAWAGLRPMTELEYEKACRGPAPPLSGEYAWGTANLIRSRFILGQEDGLYLVGGNCNIGNNNVQFVGGDGGSGPVQSDRFAGFGLSHLNGLYSDVRGFETGQSLKPFKSLDVLDTRETRGSSYYGVMGLSGNLWELCVTVGTEEGRSFKGTHGKGYVTPRGEAPTEKLGWPSSTGQGPSWRGGSWYTPTDRGQVAARGYGSGAPGYWMRTHDAGIRCARTAPSQTAVPPGQG